MISEDEKHEWQFRLVWRGVSGWSVRNINYTERANIVVFAHSDFTELIIQRRRKRDLYDPTPCEGIEHPVWRDWEASPDPEIQAILVRKGMPFRSLEK